jgi:hypothetical protein
MSTLSTSKILICIYTCKRDAESVAELKDTDWFKDVSSKDNFEIIEVLADPSIKEEYAFKNNILTLKTEESYDNLCIKTYKMIDACSKLFNFDYLLKIDSSIIKNNHISVSPAFSFYNFENKFKENFFSKPYNGYVKIEGNSLESFRNWASSKSLFVLPEALFSEVGFDKWPKSYWGGKCYSVSKELIPLVVQNESLFYKFKNLMGGCEDFCIGMILRDYMA